MYDAHATDMLQEFLGALIMPIVATGLMGAMRQLSGSFDLTTFVDTVVWDMCVLGLGLQGTVAVGYVGRTAPALPPVLVLINIVLGVGILLVQKSELDAEPRRRWSFLLSFAAVGLPAGLVVLNLWKSLQPS